MNGDQVRLIELGDLELSRLGFVEFESSSRKRSPTGSNVNGTIFPRLFLHSQSECRVIL